MHSIFRPCQICYVEGLKDAPCLQSQGSCTHVFHFQCLVKKLESKWPGARIDCQIAKGSDMASRDVRACVRALWAWNAACLCSELLDSSLFACFVCPLYVSSCPLCKKELRHPALAHLLAPIDALESIIKDRAMQRLKYEGREKDAAIVNANGAFHDDPVGFAMKQYLFYMCFKCNLPYFAGGYQERPTMSTLCCAALDSGPSPLRAIGCPC